MTREEAIAELKAQEEHLRGMSIMGREAYYMAIEALKQPEQKTGSWIPLKTRPMDEDEREEWSAKLGYKLEDDEAVIYTSLPDEGQDVLICLQNGVVTIDALEQDDCGCYFDEYGDIEGVVAWMPLPKPYERRDKQ